MTDSAQSADESRHCLDLFAGLGGFSAAFEDSPAWTVTTVDTEAEFDPDIQADVLELVPADLPEPDVMLVGHPCTTFSRAAAWLDHWDKAGEPQTEKAKRHLTMLYHTLGLIQALAPRYWFLENPVGSKALGNLGEPAGRVTYCQYGATYQKPTYLWGEHPPMDYRKCKAGDPCHESGALEDEYDNRPLPRDPAERAKVPRELSEAILEAVEDAYANPPPEQSLLTEAA